MARQFFPILLLLLGSVRCFAGVDGTSDSIQLFTMETHSRLIFRVDEGVPATWKEIPGGFELFFKGIGVTDLGAPFGSEETWSRELASRLVDTRLKQITFQESSAGLKVIGKWKFPSGDKAPADPRMERFEYREKSPARYVVDFWQKNGPTVAEVRARKLRAAREAELRRSEEIARKHRDRRLALEKARAEADNTVKFCEQALSDQNEVLLKFTPVHQKVDVNHWFSTTTPDSDYVYLTPEGEGRDAQYARLALDLYRQGKPALVIRTLDFFDKEQPLSSYREQMKFLRANALIRLGMNEEGERILNGLKLDGRDHAVTLQAALFVAAKAFERNQSLAALEDYLWLATHYPKHRLDWVFHLLAAESLFQLKQTERAAKEYQWVALNAPTLEAQAEGATRMGDLYLNRQQYERALASYAQAINNYPDVAEEFPSLYLNRAEALYHLGQYDRARESFESYLKKYPSQPYGWRATYRLAEISARRTDPASREQAHQFYLDTVNRYPYSTGAVLARFRLIPCGDHGGFDFNTATRFYQESKGLDASQDIVMSDFSDYRALSRVRAMIGFGKEREAVDVAISELEGVRIGTGKAEIGSLLGTLFRKSILALLSDGKKYDALTFYRQHQKLAQGDQDSDYLLKLSAAASDLGLGTVAKELSDEYHSTSRRLASQATDKQKSDDPADIDQKLLKSEQSYAQAKALWISDSAKSDAKIRELLTGVIEESPYSYDRELILSLLDEKTGKPASALAHAVKAQLLMPTRKSGISSDEDARVSYWLASLQARAGDSKAAAQMYRSLVEYAVSKRKDAASPSNIARVLGIPAVPPLEELVVSEAEIFAKQGKWGEAATAYAGAVDHGLGSNRILFEYARALEKNEERSKSDELIKKVAESKVDDFWRKLAREALANREKENNPE